MAENSNIEWTDHTFNPWEGCTKVSPGCAHCYAETRNQRFSAGVNWGKGAPRRRTSVQNWNQPIKWNRAAGEKAQLFGNIAWARHVMDQESHRPRVFCASLADWLDDEVPIGWLIDLLDLIRLTPNLDWLLLTKRPENWMARIKQVYLDTDASHPISDWALAWFQYGQPRANVWIGTTVEDQTRADERIPVLLSIPAKVRFLSCEPLLGAVTLTDLYYAEACANCGDGSWFEDSRNCCSEPMAVEIPRINWVICGGESGPAARPMHPDWARGLRDQCKAAGVPFFFKQWGEWAKYIDREKEDPDWTQNYSAMRDSETFHYLNLAGGIGFHGERFHVMQRVGKKVAGRLLAGMEHSEFPEVTP